MNTIIETIDTLLDENRGKEAEHYMLAELEKAREAKQTALELRLLNELMGYYRQTSEKEPLLSVIEAALKVAAGELDYATTVLNVANAYRSLGMLQEAGEHYAITEQHYQTLQNSGALSDTDMRLGGLYNNISLYYQEIGDYEKALHYLQETLRIVTAQKAGFEIAVAHANLANTYVLAKDFKKAREYARMAILLFQARGVRDPHYCAALSALGTCCFEEGQFVQARQYFAEGAGIVERTFGRNRQYDRLMANVASCDKALRADRSQASVEGDKNCDRASEMDIKVDEACKSRYEKIPGHTGLSLAKAYYETYGEPMLSKQFPAYKNRIAVGLVGKGSECFGFDDALSADHDFGPEFCMWLDDETYAEIGEELQKAYEELPSTFCGYTRTTTRVGKGRRGVLKISDFFERALGNCEFEKIDYANVEDYHLAECVNGEVFSDPQGLFTKLRQQLMAGYPDNIRKLKLAEDAARFSQCGQYNYGRMLQRNDAFTARMMLSDCLKHGMKLYHHLYGIYPPHDKWLYRSTGLLPEGEQVVKLLDKISARAALLDTETAISESIEELGAFFAAKLYALGDVSDIDPYLDHHTEELIFKAGISNLPKEELVDRIVKLEFEAFDKVKNEGGRAYCQNDWPTFSIMRKSQYLTWNTQMLMQYFYDFTREYRCGHNLITEKYGRMMESTAPEQYEKLKEHFPTLSEEKKTIIEQIVGLQMSMMEAFAEEHPQTAANARSLHTYEDNIINTSYETYLRGEISTYSDKMLQLYGAYVVQAVTGNNNIARCIMENTAKLYGFEDLDTFESAIR